MTRFVVHIGMHKTASTLIQSFLNRNEKIMRGRGFDFPLVVAGKDGPKRHRHLYEYIQGKSSEDRAEIENRLKTGLSTSDVAIISAESMYRLEEAGINQISDAFGSDTRILCYFREPVSHAVSFYKQALKTGGITHSFSGFLASETSKLESGTGRYNYDAVRSLWRAQFPDFVAIPHKKTSENKIISGFLKACGIRTSLKKMELGGDRNKSASDEVSAILSNLGRAAVEGRISADQRAHFAGFVMGNGEVCGDAVKGLVRYERADISAFADTFYKHNPGIGRSFKKPRKKVVLMPEQVDLPIGELIGRLREIAGRESIE